MKTIIKYICPVFLLILFACSEDSIEIDGYGTITGTVVKQGTNQPLPNVRISTSPTSSTVFTNDSGVFTLSNVPTGDYSVEASKDGLLTSFEGVTLSVNQTVNVVFEMLDNTAINQPPAQPTLISPDDNSLNLGVNVELEWESSDIDQDDLIYTIELRNDQNSQVVTIQDIVDTTYTLTNLNYGTQYFWQIGVSDNVNPIVWSTSRTFTTTTNPNHRYLFTRTIGSNEVIFSAELDDNGNPIELQITSENDNSWRPRKNVITGSIAFLRNVGAETHLFTMLPDGSNVNQVTSTVPVSGFRLSELDFSWSANGDKLLYSHFDKLYSINNDGSGLNMIYQTSNGDFITECDWSNDGTLIALKTNNTNGYGVNIYTIDMSGTVISNVLSGVTGAAGGINLSVDNSKILYCRDVSGFEDTTYRQLDTHVFIYDFNTTNTIDISNDKPVGFIDVDPRFSPNEAEVLCTYTSNDGISERMTQVIDIAQTNSRTIIFNNAKMPDWE